MGHTLIRTNKRNRGLKFIGKCIKCGKTQLPLIAVKDDCPADSGDWGLKKKARRKMRRV